MERRTQEEKELHTWQLSGAEDPRQVQEEMLRDNMRAFGSLPTGAQVMDLSAESNQPTTLRCAEIDRYDKPGGHIAEVIEINFKHSN